MHSQIRIRNAGTFLLLLLFALGTVVFAGRMASPFDSATEKKNIDEYIVLLRENLSQQRDEITGAMLQLTRDQSEKFWPIYDDYEKALGKLKDSRIQNLKTYASGYGQMTDEQLDRVIKEELNLRKQRDELMNRFYEQIKQSLGAETAARFLLVESQVELISDLQLDSTLPVGE